MIENLCQTLPTSLGKFFMSKNVFAYFHELKDVDSRNEKNPKNNTYPEFSEKQFFLKKTAVSLFSKF